MEGCENVREAFTSFFKDGLDSKSQVAAYLGDELIINLYGHSTNDGYTDDSLQNVFSSGKTVASILMGIMVGKGFLEWDAPVTDYWPEWGNNGKGHIKVVNVMRHEGCLPYLS